MAGDDAHPQTHFARGACLPRSGFLGSLFVVYDLNRAVLLLFKTFTLLISLIGFKFFVIVILLVMKKVTYVLEGENYEPGRTVIIIAIRISPLSVLVGMINGVIKHNR